jgi:putative chitinase
MSCPKCGGWGIGHIETYERSPCPECGLGMGDAMILTPTTGAELQRRLNDASPEHRLIEDGNVGPKTLRALFHYMGAGRFSAVLGACASVDFERHKVNTCLRIAHWFAQFGHESCNFQKYDENLNYSAKRLMAVWPKRFPTLAIAQRFERNPEALANEVYGGRMGNVSPGDGWKYRGRGPMITGRENYKMAERGTGLPLLANPDLAAEPEHFTALACEYWDRRACNQLADRDDLEGITRVVNGGKIGLAERRHLLLKINRVLV